MKAIQMLEREGLIVRLSPKKFALTVHPSTPESENSIGLIGFEGDLYGNLGSRLAHSLYDRNIFAYSLNSSGSIPDFDRLLTRILGNGIRTLIFRDGSPMPVKSIESRKDKFSQFILMLSIYNRWNIPYHGVLLDQAFPMYDGLLKLCEAGCKNIHVLNAGDQGRGFAVVASEVRSLAGRSAQAAREIKGIIDQSVSKVEAGSLLVSEAGQTMQGIVESVGRVSGVINDIRRAAEEQREGIDLISASMNGLDQATQQNAAMVEESAAGALALADETRHLRGALSGFKMVDAPGGVRRIENQS